jgi:DNA replication protein DnaC
MKYCDIIGLPDYFESYFDMTSEHKDYWMRFVPNERFNNILRTTIDSLESLDTDKRKSIFMQGTFGTGKSHAAAVIKHLLWDDLEVVNKYITRLEMQLRARVLNFRHSKRVFPVILKGISNITDNRTFSLAIEKAVKDALKSNKIKIQTESDFEKMIYQITKNPLHIDWEQLITSTPEIKMYVNSTKDLINKLENKDITILQILETKIIQKGGHFTISTIDKWLIEVLEELKTNKIADYIILFWDEFTSIMQHHNRNELLNQLQTVAELSKNYNIFLFVISHKTAEQVGLGAEEVKKTLDRFDQKDYTMEPNTTYHLIAAAITKKDEKKI